MIDKTRSIRITPNAAQVANCRVALHSMVAINGMGMIDVRLETSSLGVRTGLTGSSAEIRALGKALIEHADEVDAAAALRVIA